MASKNRSVHPIPDELAPDPARTYERAKPEKEAGMGRLDNNSGTPTCSPDCIEESVRQKQGSRQLNADDVINAADGGKADGYEKAFACRRCVWRVGGGFVGNCGRCR